MTHEFEVREQIELDATPEQVWEAIATGPGVDSWLMGRNEIQSGLGGRNKMDMGVFAIESTVTAWDPPKHFAFKGDPAPDGAFHAFEYLIEGRDGGSAVLRFVHSGFLGGDWEAEYDALRKGDPVYLHKLAQYVKYFPGRFAAPVGGFAAQVPDKEHAWRTIYGGLGLSGSVPVGEKVHLTPSGLAPLDGEVFFLNEDFFGVRTDDGIYVFIHGYQGAVVLGHHIFGGPGQPAPDVKEAEQAWQSWLSGLFA
ncbi:MAG TPA: SRPBCC domain-containing protein [Actinocrinis sp.]|uniref:SRPBCC family protein n=1 Tax=Actinocrinis sp. TaxID=1920516 RepID=UPI002DDCCEB0|nr:SRPBCC domain-containing protein [Actinocrinis sp.]HEV2346220.1 SRPBCC domain-containing protein [Actinocrinis sp.]